MSHLKSTMMNDLYLKEIQLSRELARVIEQYSQSIPEPVFEKWVELLALYQKQIEAGIQ